MEVRRLGDERLARGFFRDKLVHLFLKKKLTLVVSLLANARLNG